MLAPCKDCTERYVGCHSKCEKYKEFDKFRKSILEKKYAENKKNDDFWATHLRRTKWKKK